MKLIFFDETKNTEEYPHYHIGALCVDERHVLEIESKVNELSIQIFKDKRLSRKTEFHACEIYHRKKNFKDMLDPVKRIEILNRLLEIVSEEAIQKMDIQINTEKLVANTKPQDIAFMFLCERCEALLKPEKCLGILIGDRDSDTQSECFSVDLSKYRIVGTDFAYGQQLEYIFESVHFTHSHLSRFLQLADTYTWALQFLNRHKASTNEYHKALIKAWSDNKNINLFPNKYKEWPKRIG